MTFSRNCLAGSDKVPILPREDYLHPADLFEEDNLHRSETRWSVAHTKPRQEKAISRELLNAGLSFFLPCAKQVNESNRKTPPSYLPVFPGYLFVNVKEAAAIPNRARDRMVRLMEVSDQERLDEELRRVWWLLGADVKVESEDSFEPGASVEIRMGPMAGIRGILVERKNECRFVVRVDFIQKGISIVVDRSFVKLL